VSAFKTPSSQQVEPFETSEPMHPESGRAPTGAAGSEEQAWTELPLRVRATTDESARELREQIYADARTARQAFESACNQSDPERAEAAFAGAVGRVLELWVHAPMRDIWFRDLLAAVDVAIRHRAFIELNGAQRDAISLTLRDLARWHVGEEHVCAMTERFVAAGIDLTRPLKAGKRRFVVTITEAPADEQP
jgi:hypothetical protein